MRLQEFSQSDDDDESEDDDDDDDDEDSEFEEACSGEQKHVPFFGSLVTSFFLVGNMIDIFYSL